MRRRSGIAACFDLDGQRKWITRVDTDHIVYGLSPALADGVFVAFFGKLFGFDAETGKLKWTQHRINKNVAAVLAAKLAGQDVVVTQAGEIIRPSDGHLLFRPRRLTTGDQGWAPPVILGDTMYSPRYGVNEINIFDFTGCEGVTWQPQHVGQIGTTPEVNRKPDGGWIDRWTAGSPLVWEGLVDQIDIYGNLFVSDIAEKKMIYRQAHLSLRQPRHNRRDRTEPRVPRSRSQPHRHGPRPPLAAAGSRDADVLAADHGR